MSMDTHITLRQAVIGALVVLALAATFTAGTLVTGSRSPSAAASTTAGTSVTTTSGAQSPGITVTGTATVTGTPDTLRLAMSVTSTRSTVGDALAQANAAAARVQKALKNNGVAAKDLQTSGMSIYPQYAGSGSTITGYQVRESLTASLRDLGKAGAAISAAVTAGGNDARVDSVGLDLEDTGTLLTAARAKAVSDARTKAQQYADAADRGLGDLTSLTETVTSPSTPYAYDGMKATAPAPVPIQAGSQDVQVSVTAVFALR